jgi:hypothetical protein
MLETKSRPATTNMTINTTTSYKTLLPLSAVAVDRVVADAVGVFSFVIVEVDSCLAI